MTTPNLRVLVKPMKQNPTRATVVPDDVVIISTFKDPIHAQRVVDLMLLRFKSLFHLSRQRFAKSYLLYSRGMGSVVTIIITFV